MKNLKAILLLATLFVAVQSWAVPAKRGTRTFVQPNGETVEVTLHGDESFHYYMTTDQHPLVETEDGSLWFAQLKGNTVVASQHLASNPAARSKELQQELAATSGQAVLNAMVAQMKKATVRRTLPQEGLGRFETTFPKKGNLKALVVLVEYSDVKFTIDNPQEYFSNMLNQDDFSQYGGTGSARQYFSDASNGQFILQSDVYGPVTLPRERSYYGGNNAFGNDYAPEDMVVHALGNIDADVDFSQYDCDKDGILDNVFVFYAGTGEASGGPAASVWPHAWQLSVVGKSFTIDGVLVDHYACTNELQGSLPDGIGTFCHEFSHIMGLPDLYNTGYSGVDCTPNEWSIMDYGPYNNNSRTPPTYSAYERNAMGWLQIDAITEGRSVVLDNLLDSNSAALIPTSRTNEFFLFENRQQTSWDKFLPYHGMIIWHVDYDADVWYQNIVNNDSNHQYVDLVEATSYKSNKKTWSWPGTSLATSFTDSTTPAFVDWNGKSLGLPITEIIEHNGKIYFDVAGGDFELLAPENITISDVTPISFQAHWNAVDRAMAYTVSVSYQNDLVREYVPGFRNAKVNAPDTSLVITGLQPETVYTIEVCAVAGSRTSPAISTTQLTPVLTFPYTTPQVLEAINVSENGFTAQWLPVEGAVDYLLTVEGAFEVDPITDVCNFGSLIFRVPKGWEYSLKTSKYTDPNWCGAAVPAAKLNKDGAYIVSPEYENDVLSCSFWARLTSSNSDAAVLIEGLQGNEWVEIAKLNSISPRGTTYTLQSIPEGTRQLRFTYLQYADANLALDDISIEVGGVQRAVLDGYNAISTGNVTQYDVTNLPEDETGFYYRIVAVSESNEHSLESMEQYVERVGASVADVEALSPECAVITSTDGTVKCIGPCGDTVEVYTVDGHKLITTQIGSDNTSQLSIDRVGFYIVRIGNCSFKIFNR